MYQTRVIRSSCPKCRERGKDRAGDNLAIYPDGGSHCFSCGYHTSSRKRVMETEVEENVSLPDSGPWNPANHNWLSQYLTPKEISENFYYAPSIKRHIYPKKSSVTNKFSYEARSVKETPKSLFCGEKLYNILGPVEQDGIVVVVEDIVSAIKVSRNFGALCLFGSHLPGEWMARLSRSPGIKKVIIWLDHDKYDAAIEYARKMSHLKETKIIVTKHDPKDITDIGIIKEVDSLK